MVSTRRQAALGQTSTDAQSSAANNAHPRGPTSATESEGEEEPSSPEARSPRDGAKETTTTKRAPKRRKGKWSASMKKEALSARESKLSLLRSFMQLPLDIILEMFGHLHPRALLSIARTSKELRAMVFSQRHADLWKNAREEAGVPRPPEGFSEPRWASLLFDTSCCQHRSTPNPRRSVYSPFPRFTHAEACGQGCHGIYSLES
ncbi:hypothetical protein FA13DRAFT_1725645 [Coprinellus micaceus]|uniref:F-box domain-containing protein n=1 Tax=Coprinellus micaceus TaxID=71717 RepID=A0A4Y7TVR3_COPMI|nr:hypothetical protein FA13DRAFT_1725645 [Coprinellus micaceus]